MFEKPLRSGKQSQTSRAELDPIYDEWAKISSLRSLLRSHAELCSALRSAGRQIFRLEGNVDYLSKLRETIKSAETLRKTWRNVSRTVPDAVLDGFEYQEDQPQPRGEEILSLKTKSKAGRRARRSHPPRVLNFRTGDAPQEWPD